MPGRLRFAAAAAGVCFACRLLAADCVDVAPSLERSSRTWTTPRAAQSGATWGTARRFEHVVIIVLENQDYADVIGDPGFSRLAARGYVFSRFRGNFHPSYPNYLAMIGGGYFGTVADQLAMLEPARPTIVDALEAKGLTWAAYAERYPGRCFLGAHDGSGLYQRKHVPFLSFASIARQPRRCAQVVELAAFDWRRLPNYAFVTPDMCNDGHNEDDCPGAATQLGRAGAWLERFLAPALAQPSLLEQTLVVITFDESRHYQHNHIFTEFLGGMVEAGGAAMNTNTDAACLDHYNVLRTIEDNFGLPTLGGEDSASSPISGVWK